MCKKFTVKEIAAATGDSISTIYRDVERGRFSYTEHGPGKKIRILSEPETEPPVVKLLIPGRGHVLIIPSSGACIAVA